VVSLPRPQRHEHHITQRWTGDDGAGTARRDFSRDGELSATGRPTIPTGPTPEYQGAPGNWNPEDLLVGAVSQCTMIWFLHLCQRNGVVVSSYVDDAVGTLTVTGSRGNMTAIHLGVTVRVMSGDEQRVRALFEKANELCYVARSLTAEITHELTIERGSDDG
jgi:organic hydroperoxide reductase OsmC/OhrA